VGVGDGGNGRVGVGEGVGEGVKVLDAEGEGVLTWVAIGIKVGETAQLASNKMKIAANNV
jgi:hypothetical protein